MGPAVPRFHDIPVPGTVFPERRATAAVLSNTYGLGSRSGEMVELAVRLAELCVPAR